MDIAALTKRYDTLCKELRHLMSASNKWTGLPALLDEMHAVRCLYRSRATGSFVSSDAETGAHHHQKKQPFRYHGSLVL
jgi:hypothetical protein